MSVGLSLFFRSGDIGPLLNRNANTAAGGLLALLQLFIPSPIGETFQTRRPLIPSELEAGENPCRNRLTPIFDGLAQVIIPTPCPFRSWLLVSSGMSIFGEETPRDIR